MIFSRSIISAFVFCFAVLFCAPTAFASTCNYTLPVVPCTIGAIEFDHFYASSVKIVFYNNPTGEIRCDDFQEGYDGYYGTNSNDGYLYHPCTGNRSDCTDYGTVTGCFFDQTDTPLYSSGGECSSGTYSVDPITAIVAYDDLQDEIPDEAVLSKALTDEIVLYSNATHDDGIENHNIHYTLDDWVTTKGLACGATGVCELNICTQVDCPLSDNQTVKYKMDATPTGGTKYEGAEKDFSVSFWIGFPDQRTGSYITVLRPEEYIGDNNEPEFVVYPDGAFQIVFFVGHQGYDELYFAEYTDGTFTTEIDPMTGATASTEYVSDLTATATFAVSIADSQSKYFSLSNHETQVSPPLALLYFTVTGDNTSNVKTMLQGSMGNVTYCDTVENSFLRALCVLIVPTSDFFPRMIQGITDAFNTTFVFVGDIKDIYEEGREEMESQGTSAPVVPETSAWNGVSVQIWDMTTISPYRATFRGYMSIVLWLLFGNYVLHRAIFALKSNA